jgi:hypothetical protein
MTAMLGDLSIGLRALVLRSRGSGSDFRDDGRNFSATGRPRRVLRPIHLTHTACPEALVDAIVLNGCVDHDLD